MYTIKTGLKAGQKRGKARNFTPGSRTPRPKPAGWSIKAGQGVSKAGRRDIEVEIGTVPPKEGRLTHMKADRHISEHNLRRYVDRLRPSTLYLLAISVV